MTKTGKNNVTFSHTNNFPAHRGGVNYLDLIRITATIMVLTVHLFQHLLPAESPIRSITNLGDRGVPIFFALSGFLIMFSTNKSSLFIFYMKRIFKIIPLYYFIVTLLVFFYEMPTDEYGLGWIRYYLFMNEIVPAQHKEWISICGFWCMPSFIIFYLISPILNKFTHSFAQMGLIVLGSYIAGKVLTSFLNPYYEINTIRSFINTLPIFFYGCWGYVAQKTDKKELFLTISILILIVCSSINLSNYQIWGVATTAVIISARNISLSPRIKQSIFLYWFAKLSFTIFLSHYLVLIFLNTLQLSPIVYTTLFIMATAVLAFILHISIERWSSNTLSRVISNAT